MISTDNENKFETIIVSSFVPLRLVDEATGKVYWRNPKTSSPRFCRPIKIEYAKETTEKIKEFDKDLKKQIEELQEINVAGCQVKLKMFLTMIDGKVFMMNFFNLSTFSKILFTFFQD